MNDPLMTLEALRPRHDEAPVCMPNPTSGLDAVLASAVRPSESPRQPRRPLLGAGVVAAAAACAAVAVLVVPVVGDRDRPGLSAAQAERLHELATRAGEQPSDLAGDREYRYFKHMETGTSETTDGTVKAAASYMEEWVAADGTVWRRDTFATGQIKRYRFAPDQGTGSGSYSRDYLSSLPTDPHALYQHLRDHANGSSSRDEAIFVAVGDMLRTNVASPSLRAAAINALSYLPVDVQPGTLSATGTGGVLISMDRPRQQGNEALLVDEDTSAVLEERNSNRYDRPVDKFTARSLTSVSTLVASDITDELPADLADLT